jgi:hypothetical protein
MKIDIKFGDKKKNGLLDKIVWVLIGIFMTSLIFALLIQALGKAGIYLGLLVSILLVFSGFYYIEKGTRLRLIAWSILITIISCSILFAVFLNFVEKSLEGF